MLQVENVGWKNEESLATMNELANNSQPTFRVLKKNLGCNAPSKAFVSNVVAGCGCYENVGISQSK